MSKNLTLLLIPVIALGGWIGWQLFSSSSEPMATSSSETKSKMLRPDVVISDQLKVFKRAFWRTPSANDEILYAEQREWLDDQGVTKWQWFIAVRASPELRKYLKDDNAFGLVQGSSAPPLKGKPHWFSFDPSKVTTLNSQRGKMQLVFDNGSSTIYACDEGGGLQRGAAEQAPIILKDPPVNSGRLPNSSPPKPQPFE